MSKADEMLKELGYVIDNKNNYAIQYYKKDELFGERLDFCIQDKTFNKYNITMEELKAINEKVKELGWLDEN